MARAGKKLWKWKTCEEFKIIIGDKGHLEKTGKTEQCKVLGKYWNQDRGIYSQPRPSDDLLCEQQEHSLYLMQPQEFLIL